MGESSTASMGHTGLKRHNSNVLASLDADRFSSGYIGLNKSGGGPDHQIHRFPTPADLDGYSGHTSEKVPAGEGHSQGCSPPWPDSGPLTRSQGVHIRRCWLASHPCIGPWANDAKTSQSTRRFYVLRTNSRSGPADRCTEKPILTWRSRRGA